MGGRASETPSMRDMNIVLKCFHARRDKHPLFGSDTAAPSALKLYFHCPWVLFIDPVLSVLPCVSGLMFWARLLPVFPPGTRYFSQCQVEFLHLTRYVSPTAYVLFLFVSTSAILKCKQVKPGKEKYKNNKKKKTGPRETAGEITTSHALMKKYLRGSTSSRGREATNSARICFFFFCGSLRYVHLQQSTPL